MEISDLRSMAAESVNKRRVIGGSKDNLMQIRPLKHSFAAEFVERAIENNWTHHEVDLTEDAKLYATGQLIGGELTAYKRSLAFLSNLDGIQLNNLTNNINRYITSQEISLGLARHAYDEALHVLTYAQMIESIGFDPIEIYWMYKTDPLLAEKNEYIMQSSMLLGSGYTPENFVMAVAANIALEGIYFYSGFLTFYTLARMGRMRGSAKNIKLIQRDEVNHLNFFVNIWHALRQEEPQLFTPELYGKVRELMKLAVEYELSWGKWIISDGVLGLSDQIYKDFLEHICDRRVVAMGMKPIYGTKNPVPWFDEFSRVNGTEEAFFETKVAAYTTEDLEWD